MARHSLDFWLTSEDLPDPDNRVTLDRDGGIVLRYRPNNEEGHRRLTVRLKELMRQQSRCAEHGHVSFWVECTFETALERALARRQEGLSAEETIAAYRTIYFPAQEIHLARDAPRRGASAIVDNDPRLAAAGAAAR